MSKVLARCNLCPDLGATFRPALLLVSLCLLVAGCGEPTAAPQPVPATAEQPADIPTPATATATPVPDAALLPAALYYVQDNQVWRLASDGSTTTQITSEPDTAVIIEFAVSPVRQGVAYVVTDKTGSLYKLVRMDAAGNTVQVLLEVADAALRSLVWSPDGDSIAYALQSLDFANPAITSGVYQIAAAGGEPQVLQADVQPEPGSPPADGFVPSYTPLAWSPDGTRLLLIRTVFEGQVLIVKNLASGALTPPDGFSLPCCDVTWAPDGMTFYAATDGDMFLGTTSPGIWQADAHTGTVTPLLESDQEGPFLPVVAPYAAADGYLYFFMTRTTQAPAAGSYYPPLSMYRMAADGSGEPERLRDDSYGIEAAFWAQDGSGAVALTQDTGSRGFTPMWLPASGDLAVRLPITGTRLQWGSSH